MRSRDKACDLATHGNAAVQIRRKELEGHFSAPGRELCSFRTFIAHLSVLIALFCGACSIIPDPKPLDINYYDFGVPGADLPQLPPEIGLGTVKSATPGEKRMIFRDSPNHVRFDECNRWAAPPEDLLFSRLSALVPDSSDPQKKGSLSVKIMRLECDLIKRSVSVELRFELSDANCKEILVRTYSDSPALGDLSASNYALGVSGALDKAIKKFFVEISQSERK